MKTDHLSRIIDQIRGHHWLNQFQHGYFQSLFLCNCDKLIATQATKKIKTQKSKLHRLGALRLPMPWHMPRVKKTLTDDADAVILLHGLWRSMWAMEPMATHLHQQGYHTINVPYPSFRKPMEEITKVVHQALTRHGGDRKLHFVTHSLGGVILRKVLSELDPDQVGRIVMLAPPNQGSEIIDWFSRCAPLKFSLGPAGMQLGSEKIDAPALPGEIDSAVIMGKRSIVPFFRNLLDDDNDGIVSVERGRVDGMNEFHVLDADHTFIASDPKVMKMTQYFLRTGKLNKDSF